MSSAITATAAIALYTAFLASPLLTVAAECIGAGMPVAVRADWPSDQVLHFPVIRSEP